MWCVKCNNRTANIMLTLITCVDPENFVKGGPTLMFLGLFFLFCFLVDEGWVDQNSTINGVSLEC